MKLPSYYPTRKTHMAMDKTLNIYRQPFPHSLPPPQDFAIEVLLLINHYIKTLPKHTPHNIPFLHRHHSLPPPITDNLSNIFPLYIRTFLAPSMPTNVLQCNSPYKRDKIYGSLGPTFITQWTRQGLAHITKYHKMGKKHWPKQPQTCIQ